MAKLYEATGPAADANDVLAPALEGFALKPKMPEIAETREMLAALAQTEEVKAAGERRERLARLQLSYGIALVAARGQGALEAKEAFARVRDIVVGDGTRPRSSWPITAYGPAVTIGAS